MEFSDSFNTIKETSEIEIRIKGSKFIGRAFPCPGENDAENILGMLRKKYYDATHNCFAYRVGIDEDIKFRYSDDGEPSGTAGKPIFDCITGRDLTNILLVVTRYFGGTKLGTGGLTHAYSEAAGKSIKKAGIIIEFITREVNLVVQFSDYNAVERSVYRHGGNIMKSDFSDVVKLTVELRLSQVDNFKKDAINITSGRVNIE